MLPKREVDDFMSEWGGGGGRNAGTTKMFPTIQLITIIVEIGFYFVCRD